MKPPTKKGVFLFPINLQLFSDGSFNGVADKIMQSMDTPPEQPPTDVPPTEPSTPEITDTQEPTPSPTKEEPLNTNQPQEPGEDNNNNPDIKNLLKDLESNILDSLQQQQPSQQPESPEEPSNEPTPEEIQKMNDELYNKLVENPTEVLNQLKQEAMEQAKQDLMKDIQPLLDEKTAREQAMQVNQELETFMSSNKDVIKYADRMAEIIKEEGLENNPMALKYSYSKAKAETIDNMPQPQSLEEMLKDENNINSILDNEDIKNKVITKYLEGLSNGGKPITVGATPGTGTTPVTPPKEKDTSWDGAKKALLNSIK